MDRSRGGRICAGETLVRTDARPALRDQHRSRGVPAVSPRTPMWALLSWNGGQPTLHLQRHEVADDRRIGASCTLVCPSCASAASRQARRLIGHRRCAERPGPRERSQEVGRLRSYHAHRRLSTVQHAGPAGVSETRGLQARRPRPESCGCHPRPWRAGLSPRRPESSVASW